MSKELGGRLGVAEAILKELSRGSVRRTALEKRVCKSTGISYACFSGMFVWLVCDGDVEKCSCDYNAPFRITRKGEASLAWRAMV